MSNNRFLLMPQGEFLYFLQPFQGIIQKKSVPCSRTLHLVTFDQTMPFSPKVVFF